MLIKRRFAYFYIKYVNLDPSGTMIQFEARGIVAADEGIQSLLREKYNGVNNNFFYQNFKGFLKLLFFFKQKTMTLENTEKLALDCLKQVMEEKVK